MTGEEDMNNCVDLFTDDDSGSGQPSSAAQTAGSNTSDSADTSLLCVPSKLVESDRKAHEENDVKQVKQDQQEVRMVEELSRSQRFEKLLDLLGKSQHYSTYLRHKLETEDEATELKRRKADERKNLKEIAADSSGATKNKGRKRKRGGKGHVSPDNSAAAKRLKADQVKRVQVSRKLNGEDIPDEQPLLLSGGIMRDYQMKGYQWMASLFEHGINGILADEMGLGKTIQTIALFCHLIEMEVEGPFLVVAPLSTVTNWVKEFNRFAPSVPVVLYHGSKAERMDLRKKHVKQTTVINIADKKDLAVRNVFVTSYEIAMNDRAFLSNVGWRFVVVDEGHRLKNMNCRLIRELKMYQAANKLLLTGTPLQNNLAELWSLLNFLMGEIFDDLSVFESWFNAKDMDEGHETEESRIVEQEQKESIISKLHEILMPFVLRRVKADVDLKIPPKKEVLIYCPMSEKQKTMYEATVNRTLAELVGPKNEEEELVVDLKGGRAMRKKEAVDYSIFLDAEEISEKKMDKYLERMKEMSDSKENAWKSINAYKNEISRAQLTTENRLSLKNRMMDLRKTTNHPYLIEYPLEDDGFHYKIDQKLVESCGKLRVLDQLLSELMKRGHKTLIFSQMTKMLDILMDYLNLKKIKFSRLDGTMDFVSRQQNIDAFNEDESVSVFLLSTRAGGLGINLTAADTCIIYDSDWNPQQDLQAQDRCHRIGQTKPVMIYRLVTANTIDQKIVERAAAKRKLEKMIIHSKKFKSQDRDGLKKTMEAISPQELKELLSSKDHVGAIDRSDGHIFSAEELDMLLDRSDLRWSQHGKDVGKENKDTPSKKKGASKSRGKTKEATSLFKVIDQDEGGNSANLMPSIKEEMEA